MCDWFGEHSSMHQWDRWVVARRKHGCYSCGEPVRPGNRYHLSEAVTDGQWSRVRHCSRCRAIVEALFGRGVTFVNMDLNCGETWENPPPHVAALAFALVKALDEARASGLSRVSASASAGPVTAEIVGVDLGMVSESIHVALSHAVGK